jgi:hypothetical protein
MSVQYTLAAPVCASNGRAKINTLNRLWIAGLRSAYTVLPSTGQTFDAETTAPAGQTRGLTPSIKFEVPADMTAIVDFISAIRAHELDHTTLLDGDQFPSAYLAAPFRLTVYKVFVSTSPLSSGGGVTTLDPYFIPISQLVTRAWYDPTLLGAAPEDYPQEAVSANTVVEPLSTGTYVATVTCETNGDVTTGPAPAFWESLTNLQVPDSGWGTTTPVQPFGLLQVVFPPILQIRATMYYVNGTRNTPAQQTVAVPETYLCTLAVPPAYLEDATGITLPECVVGC